TPDVEREFRPRPLHELAAEVGAQGTTAARRRLAGLDSPGRRQWLRQGWARLLGDVEPKANPKVLDRQKPTGTPGAVERVALEVEREIILPLVLLLPSSPSRRSLPVVLGVAQEGKSAFLRQRSEAIADLLNGGAAVCLVDVRG